MSTPHEASQYSSHTDRVPPCSPVTGGRLTLCPSVYWQEALLEQQPAVREALGGAAALQTDVAAKGSKRPRQQQSSSADGAGSEDLSTVSVCRHLAACIIISAREKPPEIATRWPVQPLRDSSSRAVSWQGCSTLPHPGVQSIKLRRIQKLLWWRQAKWRRLEALHDGFAPFRDASIDRWHRKTLLSGGNAGAASMPLAHSAEDMVPILPLLHQWKVVANASVKGCLRILVPA